MSSYVESAYNVEQRRLQNIVTQCEKDLELALKALAEKKREKELLQIQFGQNRLEGEEQEKQKERAKREQFANGLIEKCQSLERLYADEIDEKINEELIDIKNHILKKDIQENLLVSLIESCENRLVNIYQRKKALSNIQSDKEVAVQLVPPSLSHDKKGIKLNNYKKKSNTSVKMDEEVSVFESKIQEAMDLVKDQDLHMIMTIKKGYLTQPDFAKNLYIRKTLPQIDRIVQKSIQERELLILEEEELNKLKDRFAALVLLLYENQVDSIPVELKSKAMSIPTLEFHCKQMERALIEKRKNEYVLSSIKKVMQNHGIVCHDIGEKEAAIQRFQYDENIEVSIMGTTQKRFVAEMSGLYFGKVPTLNDKRKSASSAKKACSFMNKIRDELSKDYGIIFETVEMIQPDEETMHMKQCSDKSFREEFIADRKEDYMMVE